MHNRFRFKLINQSINQSINQVIIRTVLYYCIKNTCKLSRDVIQKLFKSIHELPVTEVVCEPNKLKLIEPLASLNYTSPYIVRKYKEKCSSTTDRKNASLEKNRSFAKTI